MKGLLVRVGADQSKSGGGFNGPVNDKTKEFTYVPIPENKETKLGMEKPYAGDMLVSNAISELDVSVRQPYMHLDPDFEHLTYGDEGCRGCQIKKVWKQSDGHVFLVFYSGLCDMNHREGPLVYAIVGFYMIDEIVQATEVPPSRCNENAHTRRVQPGEDEIVVRAKRGLSGRLEQCIRIGSYRSCSGNPNGCRQYRVESNLLEEWGGLSVNDGWLQRSAHLPRFEDANRFLKWFRQYEQNLVARNNLCTQCCSSV